MTRNPPFPDRITMAAWALTALTLVLVLLVHLLPGAVRGPSRIRARPSRLALPVRAALRSSREDRRRRVARSGGRRHRDRRQFRDRGVHAKRPGPPCRAPRAVRRHGPAREGRRCPMWIADLLPADHDEVNTTLAGWMRAHAADLELAGRDTGRALIYAILGMIVGAMVALQGEIERQSARAAQPRARGTRRQPVERVPAAWCSRKCASRSSTPSSPAIYLVVILPAFGVDLPLRKTLIVITFVAGLLPVVGNLISNTFIVIVEPDVLRRDGAALARLSRGHPQARVFPQREDHRHAASRRARGSSWSRSSRWRPCSASRG